MNIVVFVISLKVSHSLIALVLHVYCCLILHHHLLLSFAVDS
jgi:hypothetical protein